MLVAVWVAAVAGWFGEWIGVWVDGLMNGQMDEWIDALLAGWVPGHFSCKYPHFPLTFPLYRTFSP